MNSEFRADTLQDAIDALARLGCKPTKTGDGYTALCPIHEADGKGHNPSLTLKAGDTQPVVVNCHAGCDGREILKALGINGTAHKSASIIAVYRYQTAEGRDVREKMRYQPKDFRIRHRDAAGSWVYKAGDAPPVLYRLPEVKAAIAEGRTVFICEGEKDCDLLANAGLVATTNIEGAAKPEQRPKWKREYTAQLSGAARVILLPDNDEPGRAHMAHIAAQLAGKVADLRWLALPGLPPKGDVSDWLNAGHSIDEFKALVATAPQQAERDAERRRLNDEAGQPGKRREQIQVPDDRPSASSYSAVPPWHSELMTRGDSGQILKNHYNAVAICENAYRGLIGYNQFRQRVEKRIPPPWGGTPGAWTEYDTGELAVDMAKPYASFTFEVLGGAITTVAHRHPFNPAQRRLRELADQWDGESRIGCWLADMGAKVNPSNVDYMREISECWIKGVAARVLIPGCKRDDVLVLCGEQGWGKSTFAQALADAIQPDSFTDTLGDLGNKDAKSSIRGIIIAELGELAALNKSDLESIKVFVATRSDHFREAYGRGDRDYPRTVSFIGTTNNPAFLIDPTGNRRWWPVSLGGPIDIQRFSDVVPQLLGEAAWRVLRGEAWHVTHLAALNQAARVREAHFDEDVWTSSVKNAVSELMRANSSLPGANQIYVTIHDILNAMGVRIEQQTKVAKNRVGGVLRMLQFSERRNRLPTGERFYAWYPPPQSHNSKDGIVAGQLRDSQGASEIGANPPSPTSPTTYLYSSKISLVALEASGNNGGGGGHHDKNTRDQFTPFIGRNGTKGDLGDNQPKALNIKGLNMSHNSVEVGGLKNSGGVGGLNTQDGTAVSPQRASSTDPQERRIMEQLRARPAGVADEELKRAVCTDKGTSPALVDLTLTRLAKAGNVAKVNGRWVLMGNRL